MTADEQAIAATFNEQMAIGAVLIAVAVIVHGVGLFTLRRLVLSESPAGSRSPSRAGCSP